MTRHKSILEENKFLLIGFCFLKWEDNKEHLVYYPLAEAEDDLLKISDYWHTDSVNIYNVKWPAVEGFINLLEPDIRSKLIEIYCQELPNEKDIYLDGSEAARLLCSNRSYSIREKNPLNLIKNWKKLYSSEVYNSEKLKDKITVLSKNLQETTEKLVALKNNVYFFVKWEVVYFLLLLFFLIYYLLNRSRSSNNSSSKNKK